MLNLLIIIVLLVALGITAAILIFVVAKIFLRRDPHPSGTEELISEVLDGCPLPIFEINNNHRIIQWNLALEVLSGLKKADMLGTDRHWMAFYGEKRPTMADMIVSSATEQQILDRYKNNAGRSTLIKGAYEAEDFFPSLGEGGRWYHFTASPMLNKEKILGAIEMLEDVTARRIAEQNLRYYVGQVTKVQEDERKYLARELHDSTVQTLVALIYQLDNFMAGVPNLTENEVAKLKGMHGSLKRAVEEVRGFSRQLRPPVLDDLGLVPVLEWLIGEIKKTSSLEITVETKGEFRRLNPDLELVLFRIIQEALINAAKHAHAKSAHVVIDYLPDKVRVHVTDDGVGFDVPGKIGSLPRTGKLGLAGITERAELLGGRLQISSQKGSGTAVSLEVSLDPDGFKKI